MKRLGAFGIAVLFLLSGISVPATVAQERQQPLLRPVPHANPAPPQSEPNTPPAKPKPEPRPQEPVPPQRKSETKPKPAPRSQKPQPALNALQGERRHGTARAARNSSVRIPEDRFRASFGAQHTFRIHRPVIVNGQPRFYYASYWFAIVDPWPPYWGWDDDVYVDYIDGGYYLCDALYPQVLVEVVVVES